MAKTTETAKTEHVAEAVQVPVPDGQCVVNDGTRHVGRAVNGLVCSAHANRYRSDGTPRG